MTYKYDVGDTVTSLSLETNVKITGILLYSADPTGRWYKFTHNNMVYMQPEDLLAECEDPNDLLKEIL